jgi:hypothetical protein
MTLTRVDGVLDLLGRGVKIVFRIPYALPLGGDSRARMLASGITVAILTSNTSRRVVGQWGGAGGASCEDHLAFCGVIGLARRLTRLAKPDFFNSPARTPPTQRDRHQGI